jgi:predicted RNA-binding Zn-ribbon protein involved in translation (DUF1610 family)
MCEVSEGNWNSEKNRCEFDNTADHIDCMKRTVKGAMEGGAATGLPEGAAVKGSKELIQCYSEKKVFQKTYEKVEVSDGSSQKFTEERNHIQVEDKRHDAVDRMREQYLKEKEFTSELESRNNSVSEQRQSMTCPKCGREMKKTKGNVYVCPECSSKFVEN